MILHWTVLYELLVSSKMGHFFHVSFYIVTRASTKVSQISHELSMFFCYVSMLYVCRAVLSVSFCTGQCAGDLKLDPIYCVCNIVFFEHLFKSYCNKWIGWHCVLIDKASCSPRIVNRVLDWQFVRKKRSVGHIMNLFYALHVKMNYNRKLYYTDIGTLTRCWLQMVDKKVCFLLYFHSISLWDGLLNVNCL